MGTNIAGSMSTLQIYMEGTSGLKHSYDMSISTHRIFMEQE